MSSPLISVESVLNSPNRLIFAQKPFHPLTEKAQGARVNVAQIPLAWANAKGTTPIFGVTSPAQVADAAAAASCKLSTDEMSTLEMAAAAIGVNSRGGWKRPMA